MIFDIQQVREAWCGKELELQGTLSDLWKLLGRPASAEVHAPLTENEQRQAAVKLHLLTDKLELEAKGREEKLREVHSLFVRRVGCVDGPDASAGAPHAAVGLQDQGGSSTEDL